MDNKEKQKRPDMPPVPRDFHQASHSELMPIKSSTINVLKSPLLYLVIFTAFIAIAMFDYMNDVLGQGSMLAFQNLVWATIAYLLMVTLLVVYLYSKSDKPFWAFLTNLGFVSVLLLTPLSIPYFFIFRQILPGNIAEGQSMIGHFISMLFGAGLMEELMKVTFVLFGAYIVTHASVWRQRIPDTIYNWISVRGPLDGLMMGIFGGAGFILVETGMQYVPNMFTSLAQQGGQAVGLAGALMLLLPRVIGGMVGHMCWAGITGYFIGLAVIRPGNSVKMVGLAWLGSSTLHAIWNTSSFVPFFMYLSAGVGGVLLIACLLKARQLEMAQGRAVDTYGSIVVGAEQRSAARAKPEPAAPAQPAPSPVEKTSKPGAAAANETLQLAFEDGAVPIVANQALDLGVMAAGSQAGPEINAMVSQHPTRPDVLGLKNLGTSNWTAMLRDGTHQQIAPGRNIRLAAGVKIDFGNGRIAEVKSQ